MDFTKIEGLTEEQIAALQSEYEADVSGLKAKRDELLGKVKTYQDSMTEAEKRAEEAREEAKRKEEEALKAKGDVDGLREYYDNQLKEREERLQAEASRAQAALIERDKGDAINSILANVKKEFQPFVKASLSNMIDVSYNSDNKAEFVFKEDGSPIATSVGTFLEHASKSDSWKSVLVASNSSGAGVTQSSGAEATPSGEAARKEAIKNKYGLAS